MEEFKLLDAAGKEHDYRVSLHSPKTGGLRIIKDLSPILASFSGGNLGEAVVNCDLEGLVERMVFFAHRDGKPLRDSAFFDEAFRGNYGELFELVGHIISVNRFLGSASSLLLEILKEVSDKQEELQQKLKEASNPQ